MRESNVLFLKRRNSLLKMKLKPDICMFGTTQYRNMQEMHKESQYIRALLIAVYLRTFGSHIDDYLTVIPLTAVR